MDHPDSGSSALERFNLPDVRRLDRMPSWPAWVDSLVASIKIECQRSKADGKYRNIPTLPPNSMLIDAQRAEIEQYLSELERLCEQTPQASPEYEKITFAIVTKLMLALPSNQQNELGAEASGEAYLAALDDLPYWAVAEGARRWCRGECGENERGEPYDYRWRPAPADLRRIAYIQKWRVCGQAPNLRRLLAAEPRIEFSDEHRAKMGELLASLKLKIS